MSSCWMGRTWSLLLIVVALGLLSLVSIEADDSSGLPMHSLQVTLTPAELGAKVTEDQLGAVTFGGNVTVSKQQGIEQVTVTLTADCANGWPTVVSPQSMAFINPATQRFQLTVIVPPATPVSSTTATVYAHAESLIWEEDQTASARVTVAQYFKMDVWMSQDSFESEPGGSVIGKIGVNNSGNGEDTFAISLEELPDGISKVHFNEEQVTVPYGLLSEFTFTLDVDEDLEVDKEGTVITVIIKITSLGAKTKGLLYVKTYPTYVYLPGWETKLKEDWPTYVGYVAVAAVIIVPVALVIRWRRGRDTGPEVDPGVEKGNSGT